MSKYDDVWKYIRDNDVSVLAFDEIQEIAGGAGRPFVPEVQKNYRNMGIR